MDNRKIDIRSEGREALGYALGYALRLIFENSPSGQASHWFVRLDADDMPTLVLCWHRGDPSDETLLPLPYKLDIEAAIDFCWHWLQQREDKERWEYLDHDGSNGHGFRVFCEDWGHVFGNHYAFVGVQAIWAWYGK